MEIIIAGRQLGFATLFHGPLECLLVNEGDETGRDIFGLCFPIGLVDTGRPPREPGGGRRGQESWNGRGGTRAGPQGALLGRQGDEEEMKVSILLSTIRCDYSCHSQKLGGLEKNGNCSSPVGEEGARAQQAVPASKNNNVARQVAPMLARPFRLLIRQ